MSGEDAWKPFRETVEAPLERCPVMEGENGRQSRGAFASRRARRDYLRGGGAPGGR